MLRVRYIYIFYALNIKNTFKNESLSDPDLLVLNCLVVY